MLDFKGSMDAHEVNSLREEITAVLAAFKPQDQVVLRLESPVAWCMVTGWRLRSCSVCVIKHSFNCYGRQSRCQRRLHDGLCGGQNCFRTVLLLWVPLGWWRKCPTLTASLKSKDIDIELHTAGQYKRTLTLLGENTEEGREKFREELNETHQLFKDFW